MTEQELKWRDDFEKWYLPKFGHHNCFQKNDLGEYFYTDVRARFECYCEGRKTLPVVELSEPVKIKGGFGETVKYWRKSEVCGSLDIAGITCVIKG